MLGLLALLFIAVPIIELYVIVQVAQSIGVLPTIALVLAVSAAGAWLCKREGIGLIRRIQADLDAGRVPTASVVDGFLILFGGALLLTPGFVSDVAGLALLLPPVRIAIRALAMRRFAAKARRMAAEGLSGRGGHDGAARIFVFDGRTGRHRSGGPSGRFGGASEPTVIDVNEASYDRPGSGADGPRRPGEPDSELPHGAG
jgi:UPF0716 protein FxsA